MHSNGVRIQDYRRIQSTSSVLCFQPSCLRKELTLSHCMHMFVGLSFPCNFELSFNQIWWRQNENGVFKFPTSFANIKFYRRKPCFCFSVGQIKAICTRLRRIYKKKKKAKPEKNRLWKQSCMTSAVHETTYSNDCNNRSWIETTAMHCITEVQNKLLFPYKNVALQNH